MSGITDYYTFRFTTLTPNLNKKNISRPYQGLNTNTFVVLILTHLLNYAHSLDEVIYYKQPIFSYVVWKKGRISSRII